MSVASITLPPPEKSIHPGTDFYKHINGGWLRKASVPKAMTSYGLSEEVEAVLEKDLLRILKGGQARAETGRPAVSGDDDLLDAVGRLAMSALRESKQKFSVEYLKRGLRSLGCMRDTNDLAATLGTMSRFSIPTLIDVTILPELEHGQAKYRLAISPGSVGLPDPRYYSAASAVPGKQDILYQHTRLCRDTAELLSIDEFAQAVPLEADLANDLLKAQEDTFFEMYTVPELKATFKKISWDHYFAGYGVDPALLGKIRVDSVAWLERLEDLFETVPLDQWYHLTVLHTVLHALPYLPPPFDEKHFELFERQLRGQEIKRPQIQLTMDILKLQLSAPLGILYVNRTPGAARKRADALHFVRTIQESAADRMLTLDWLGPKAREKAAKKIRSMTLCVGYADDIQQKLQTPPRLQTDNLLANIYLLEAARTSELVKRCLTNHGKTRLDKLWDEPPFAVNAYYYHETNQIVIPAGSFLWPFYSGKESQLGWDYGGLGAIIGHELTHAFDEEGKEFNEKGVAERWWSSTDFKRYKEKTKELIRLFDQAKIMDRPVNGTATLSENLADLGGLGIALDALKEEFVKRRLSEESRAHHLREFFTSYAVSWRTKERPERTLQRLFMDKHAPAELRVNKIVIQFDEWYEAFGVKTADALYIPPEERLRIF